jgi:outer membrane protein OmpA-like peptidoglycan-associated protein
LGWTCASAEVTYALPFYEEEFMVRSNLARSALLSAAVASFLAGCYTMDPYSGDKKVSDTTKGAGIGALAGAAIGALAGGHDRARAALIGAGVGALAGGAVGNYMDRQEAKLRAQLQGTGVSVVRDGDNIDLVMPGNITFATGSADLNPNFFSVLDSVAIVLKEFNKTIIDVTGHTDSTGSAEKNQMLSEQRANTVAQYLRTKGIMDQRIAVAGLGETRPVASNDTPDGRQKNRRVELTLTPLKQS